jgi:hypothetical protein
MEDESLREEAVIKKLSIVSCIVACGVLAILSSCATVPALSSRDFPPEYEPMKAEQLEGMGLVAGGSWFGTELKVDQAWGFVRTKPLHVVLCATIDLEDPMLRAGWDFGTVDAKTISSAFAGANVTDMAIESTGDRFGDGEGIRASWNQTESGLEMSVQMIMFRREKTGIVFMGMVLRGQGGGEELAGIAGNLDANLKRAR